MAKYSIGQRIRYKGRTGTILDVHEATGAIRTIAYDDGRIENIRYINAKQEAFLKMTQKDLTLIGGRGSGKTHVIGNGLIDLARCLPRAKGGLTSSTYGQILTKTLPEIISVWNDLGFIEYKSPKEPGHYIVGKKPPADWAKPYKAPLSFQNVITFWNGFTIEFLSMDRPDLARGGSYDFHRIDEALLIEKDHIDKTLYPTLRGNRAYFNHHLHLSLARYSSMPWLTKGQYLLDYKEKAKSMPKQYGYMEMTVYDNIAVLGQGYIDQLRNELDPYTFALEVDNKPSGKKQHGFYHALNDEYHVYDASHIYGDGDRLGIVSGSKDHVKSQMLHMSFDFHGWFKCATVYQERNNTEYMINSFYKKENEGIDELIDDICIHYADQGHKRVDIWGEPHGHDRTVDAITVYDRIRNRFMKYGWNCTIKTPRGTSDQHSLRYEIINEALQETNPLLPKMRFNSYTCKAVIVSMQNAEVTDKFQKNKKDEANKSYNQAYATHFSDTVDYYIMQKYGSKMNRRMLPGRGDNRVN